MNTIHIRAPRPGFAGRARADIVTDRMITTYREIPSGRGATLAECEVDGVYGRFLAFWQAAGDAIRSAARHGMWVS